MSIFILLIIILGSLTLLTSVCYGYQRYTYHKYAMEQKAIKRELLKIKDTEYQNFLLQESQNYKNQKVWS